jgi:hypothetical protein
MGTSSDSTTPTRTSANSGRRSLFFAALSSVALLIAIAGAVAYFAGGPVAERLTTPFQRVAR